MTTQSPGSHEMSTANAARTERGYSTSYTVEQSTEEVFAAILDVGAWWTGQVDGRADELGAGLHLPGTPQHYSLQRVVDSSRAAVWSGGSPTATCPSSRSRVSGPAPRSCSTSFRRAGGTELRFTHVGLVPDVECFGACSTAWPHYVNGSLRSLITTGKGLPDPW